MDNKAFPEKSYQTNPLAISRPKGAALAMLGIEGAVPLMLGARGCATVGLVQLNRHFQRDLPIETVALDEVSLISGDTKYLERALQELSQRRMRPSLAGLLVTGLGEARGDDLVGFLRNYRRSQHACPTDSAALETLVVSCPDFAGTAQEGWSDAVKAMITQYATAQTIRDPRQITVLAGWQMSPGDVEELRTLIEAFHAQPVVIPDLSMLPAPGDSPACRSGREKTAAGGPAVLHRMGASIRTLAFGEHMREAAQLLQRRTGIPCEVLTRGIGLGASDELIRCLARITGQQPPVRFQRQRSRLVEAMLNAAPIFGGLRVAVASAPDHLFSLYSWLTELGATLHCGIATANAPILRQLPEGLVHAGDLEDLEKEARGADLLIAPSSAAPIARHLSIPHLRAGIPVTDRLAGAQQTTLGYQGAWNLLCTAADLITDHRVDV